MSFPPRVVETRVPLVYYCAAIPWAVFPHVSGTGEPLVLIYYCYCAGFVPYLGATGVPLVYYCYSIGFVPPRERGRRAVGLQRLSRSYGITSALSPDVVGTDEPLAFNHVCISSALAPHVSRVGKRLVDNDFDNRRPTATTATTATATTATTTEGERERERETERERERVRATERERERARDGGRARVRGLACRWRRPGA